MPIDTLDSPAAASAHETDSQLLPPSRSRRGFPWSRALLLLVGMLLGAALLATFQASGAIPPPPVGDAAADQDSDITVTIRQTYLDQMIARRLAEAGGAGPFQNVRVNLEPGRRLVLGGDVTVLNQRLHATANGTIGVTNERVHVAFDRVRVGSLNLPAQLGDIVAEPINAELERLSAGDDFRIIDVATTTDRIIVRLAAVEPLGPRPGAGTP